MEIEGRETVVVNTDWTVGEPMMLADIGGKEVTVQVSGGGVRIMLFEQVSSLERTSIIFSEHNIHKI